MHRLHAVSKAAAVLLIAIGTPALAAPPDAGPATPGLSPAQAAVAAQQIARLKYPAERALAARWSDAKKAAEFICRPLAMRSLQRRIKGADRVFLGTDDPGTLCLASERQLKGNGQVRAGSDWRSFTFTCAMNPRNGRAVSFDAVLGDARPACR